MNYIVKGNFYFCTKERELVAAVNAYCIVENGISQGIFQEIPSAYKDFEIKDYTGCLIIPGMVDLHMHAPQYSYRGMGLDFELLQWLNTYTFPEESKYGRIEYAQSAYEFFAEELKKSYTTRAVIFGTIHTEATLLLMRLLENSGLITYVGRVNMDRNSPEYYIEDTEISLAETEKFIQKASDFHRSLPILTPRFIPCCSDRLMKGISQIQKKTHIPVQSHLSENPEEIEWVKTLNPDSQFYGDAYDKFDLFGRECRTVMAHCIFSGEDEMARMQENGVYIAHCPSSNMNLASGIAPIRRYLDRGVHVGIGSDVAAGSNLSIIEEMLLAVQVSKMRWRYISQDERPISILDAFYMATRGGGEFFGNVGSFEKGYDFDALILNDQRTRLPSDIKPDARLFRALYLHKECSFVGKYVRGKEIL